MCCVVLCCELWCDTLGWAPLGWVALCWIGSGEICVVIWSVLWWDVIDRVKEIDRSIDR